MSRVSNKPYFVYVLWSQSGRRFYIGISENVHRRLEQHNQGLAQWTSRHRPWIVVHQQVCTDYTTARKLENELKRQKGGAGFYTQTGLDEANFRKLSQQSGITPSGS
jgi:putative endonuclease